MATAIGLAMQITASSAGAAKGLNDTEKLIRALGRGAEVAGKDFDKFRDAAGNLPPAMQAVVDQAWELTSNFRAAIPTEEEFRAGMEQITADAGRLSEAFKAGATVTADYATEEEKAAEEIKKLNELMAVGAISQETYQRGMHELSGAAKAEKDAEEQRNKALKDAEQITKSVMTPQEKYSEEVAKLEDHLKEGRISQDTYNRAVEKAKKSLDDTSRSADKGEKKMSALERSVKGASGALKILASIEVTRVLVSGFTSLFSTMQSVGSQLGAIAGKFDQLNDVSKRTGIGLEALQSLNVAASLSGVENLSGAMEKLTVNIGKAADSENGEKQFEKLGLSLAEIQALSPEDQFRAVSQAISELPTEAERAAAAVQLFGKSGVELLPLFEENLAEIEARSKRLGIVLSDDQVGAIDEMNDSLGLVQQTFEGIIGQVIGNLAPLVTEIAEQFLSFVENFEGFESSGGSGVAEVITLALLDGAEFLAGIFDYFYSNISQFGDYFASTVSVLQAIGTGFYAVAEVLRGVFNIFEVAGNTLMFGLGKFLEGIGSWVSSDLENFGRTLAESSSEAMSRNAKEAGEAFGNASTAAFGGEVQKPDGPVGPGVSTVRGLREGFLNRNSEEQQQKKEEAAQKKLFDRLNSAFVSAGVKAEEIFGDNIPQAISDAQALVEQELDDAYADGVIDSEEQQRIVAAQAKYNQAIRDGEKALKEEEKNQKKRDDLMEKYNEKAAEIESERVEGLSKTSKEALKVSDVRTSEGASELIRLATGREDPAIEEYKKQLRELQKITKEISKIGTTVEIAA